MVGLTGLRLHYRRFVDLQPFAWLLIVVLSIMVSLLYMDTNRGGNSKSLEVKSKGIRVLHNYRPSVASDSFRYLRRIPSLGIFLLLLPLAHLQ